MALADAPKAGPKAARADKLTGSKGGNIGTYMQVQVDSFEDDGMAVLIVYPDGRKTFDVPRELLPEGCRTGDVFEVRFARDEDETDRSAAENRRLMGDVLGYEEGRS